LSKERSKIKAADTTTGDPSSLQHVGLRNKRMPDGGLNLTNPKLVEPLLAGHGMADSNPTILPHFASATLQSSKDGEPLVDPSAYPAVVDFVAF
jgi:hypothetical protein